MKRKAGAAGDLVSQRHQHQGLGPVAQPTLLGKRQKRRNDGDPDMTLHRVVAVMGIQIVGLGGSGIGGPGKAGPAAVKQHPRAVRLVT